jgi:hypothetical protein
LVKSTTFPHPLGEENSQTFKDFKIDFIYILLIKKKREKQKSFMAHYFGQYDMAI